MTITSPIPGLNAGDLRSTLERLAQGRGIQQWDLGAACSTDTSVQVDRGEAKQMKGAQRSSITVRVWNGDGLVGITSTSDLSEAGLERALAGAHAASAFGNPSDTPQFSPLATAPVAQLDQPLHEPRGILQLLDTLKGAEAELLDRHNAIGTVLNAPEGTSVYKFSGGKYSPNSFIDGGWDDPTMKLSPGEGFLRG